MPIDGHADLHAPMIRQSASAAAVPLSRLLNLLGLEYGDLQGERASVRVDGLLRILREIARVQAFDPVYYAANNPDIEAARLAGRISDLHEHFVRHGFFEGRLPSEPPFDPDWYAARYTDVSQAIPCTDVAALRNHFHSAGLAEGRVGSPDMLDDPSELFSDER